LASGYLAVDALDAAYLELSHAAAADLDGCCGYFPALAGSPGIVDDLPACREFAATSPGLELHGLPLRFSFIRLSLTPQSAFPKFHLDTDAATAVTGDSTNLSDRLVWRALVNLSPRADRVLHYVDLDPFSTALELQPSYACLADAHAVTGFERRIPIPPRTGRRVHGVILAANRVLHSGVDGHAGHFVAAYGCEVMAHRG
jgi:hypothetical protein